MADLLDILDKEKKSEAKTIKIKRQFEDYSDVYNKVVFEKQAFSNANSKILFNFQDSLNNLRQRGYARHPRPNEVFSLLCAYLEGESSIKCVAKDMLYGSGEWLSLAMKYQNGILHCYSDPSLKYDRKRNLYNLKSYSSETVFAISSLDEKNYLTIKELHVKNPEFVEFIWSRSFNDLPLQIRENGGFFVRRDENVWPAGRGDCNYWYDVSCVFNYWASHGVR